MSSGYNSSETLNPFLFLSKFQRNVYLKEVEASNTSSQAVGQEISDSNFSIATSIASRYKLLGSSADSLGGSLPEFDGEDPKASVAQGILTANKKVHIEEHQGICGIINIVDCTTIIESLKGQVPAHVISRFLANILAKVILFAVIEGRNKLTRCVLAFRHHSRPPWRYCQVFSFPNHHI
jgi:hypothetical protein